ncbi:MAG: zf-HC2 domain-containing protein [Candidatus Neomarinimicrobiota bacterium]
MKCEKYKNLIIDELYDEIEPADRLRLREHLRTCPDCTEKLRSLRITSQILQKWPDTEPQINLTFIPEKRPAFSDWLKKLHIRKIAYGMATACAGLLILLAIGNTRFSYRNGNFDFQVSLFPNRPAMQAQSTNVLTKADLEQFKLQNDSTVNRLIAENNDHEKIRQAVLISTLYKELEAKRQSDLLVVSRALQQVHYGTEERINQTDRALESLIQYVNYQTPVNP